MEPVVTSCYPMTDSDRKEDKKEDPAGQPRAPGTSASFSGQPRAPETSASFSEIFHLVQTGQNIPGLQKLNITATHKSPTPSQMTRRPKPWENTPR